MKDLQIVKYEEKSKLPTTSGVYFLMRDPEKIYYIGFSTNLNRRLGGRRRLIDLINDPNLSIGYILLPENKARAAETRYIYKYKPPFNRAHTEDPQSATFRFRVSEKEHEEICDRAKLEGVNVSTWLREATSFYMKVKPSLEAFIEEVTT